MFGSLILKQPTKIVETYTLKEIKKPAYYIQLVRTKLRNKNPFFSIASDGEIFGLFQAFLNPLTEVCIEKKDVASFRTVFTGRGFNWTCT